MGYIKSQKIIPKHQGLGLINRIYSIVLSKYKIGSHQFISSFYDETTSFALDKRTNEVGLSRLSCHFLASLFAIIYSSDNIKFWLVDNLQNCQQGIPGFSFKQQEGT